jgi:hypothetical protein
MGFVLQILLFVVILAIVSSIWMWIKTRVRKVGEQKVDEWVSNYDHNIALLKDAYESKNFSTGFSKVLEDLFYRGKPLCNMLLNRVEPQKAICLEPDTEFIKAYDNLKLILSKNGESVVFLKTLVKDGIDSEWWDSLSKSIVEYGESLGRYLELRQFSSDIENRKKRKQENKDFHYLTDLGFERVLLDDKDAHLSAKISQVNEKLSQLVNKITR